MNSFRLFALGFALLFTPIVASAYTKNQDPAVHQVNKRLKEEWVKISQSVKTGRLTSQQAASFKDGLKTIRQQETAFFKQNGNHQLTANQQSQLDHQLDAYDQSLPK